MFVRRSVRYLLVTAGLVVGATSMSALPNPNEPIDATKRASISTSGAVRPSGTAMNGSGVVGGRVIRANKVPLTRSTLNGDRAAVDVREARAKENIRQPEARKITARKFDVRRASDRPAAIPTIDRDRFSHLLREYEEGRVPASDMVSGDVQMGDRRVNLADINRFAGPRAALESQGIPVTSAGAGESSALPAIPVPVPQEKNNGAEDRR